jgi:hypothetical protein
MIISQIHKSFDVDREALQAAVAASGLPAWVYDEATAEIVAKEYAKVVGSQNYKFMPPPFARDYPALVTRTGPGDLWLLPWNSGNGGWICQIVQETRSTVATGPMVLSRNTETLYAVPVVFHESAAAASAGLVHTADFRRTDPIDDRLFFAPGPTMWRQPQPAAVNGRGRAAREKVAA